ncbi:MAG: MORN repeat protein, partial [Mesotoga prima]
YVMNIADLETDGWKEMATIEQEETREIEYY